MSRDEIKKLHDLATEARGEAHRAYEIALKNRKADGDTEAAYATLLKVNRLRDQLYAALLAADVK